MAEGFNWLRFFVDMLLVWYGLIGLYLVMSWSTATHCVLRCPRDHRMPWLFYIFAVPFGWLVYLIWGPTAAGEAPLAKATRPAPILPSDESTDIAKAVIDDLRGRKTR